MDADATVRTDQTARGTADAVVVLHDGESISFVIHLACGEGECFGRTSRHTERAAFAAFCVDGDSSFDLTHYYLFEIILVTERFLELASGES